jgi:dihydroneopterin aldolase
LSSNSKLVAVLFADEDPNFDLLPLIAKSGFYGAMLDTANKNNGHLLSYLNMNDLQEFVVRASTLGLETGLAGSIQISHIGNL